MCRLMVSTSIESDKIPARCVQVDERAVDRLKVTEKLNLGKNTKKIMITYRKAFLSDAEKLAEIRSNLLIELNHILSEADRIIVEQITLKYFKKAFYDNTFVSWIALDNEEIIATSGLSFSIVPPLLQIPDGKVAYIMNMFTFPSYRNRGIGTELLNRIVEEAKQLGYKKITLNASEMGKPLYEKYGFKDVHNAMVLFV